MFVLIWPDVLARTRAVALVKCFMMNAAVKNLAVELSNCVRICIKSVLKFFSGKSQ